MDQREIDRSCPKGRHAPPLPAKLPPGGLASGPWTRRGPSPRGRSAHLAERSNRSALQDAIHHGDSGLEQLGAGVGEVGVPFVGDRRAEPREAGSEARAILGAAIDAIEMVERGVAIRGGAERGADRGVGGAEVTEREVMMEEKIHVVAL